MNLSELLPALHDLPRADKFRAVQFLTSELAQEENVSISNGWDYPVWSPFDASQAAVAMERYLNDQSGKR